MSKPKVEIWTDGSSNGERGPGGWAALLTFGKHEKELSDGSRDTTANIMEFTAIIEGLAALNKPCQVLVYSDSQLAVYGLSGTWKLKAPHLRELRLKYRKTVSESGHTVQLMYVPAHVGIEYNERVDELAKAAKARFE